MRELWQLLEASNEDLPDIYCDMDQVLCNFMKGADEAVGGDFVTSDKETRWKAVTQVKGFWANLDWLPNSKRLYQTISKYNPHILSAYTGRDPASKSGKMKWVKKNTKIKRGNIHLVLRAQKKDYATSDEKPNVLIDDYIKNIREWESAGGIGILHKDVGKTINELKRLGFK